MTLRHLIIFIKVCDENNMTRAAASLHMTQPAVSLAVHELEEHYGTLLFERLGRRLFLTGAGHSLLDYARHIISLNRQAESAMLAFGKFCPLRVGASVTVGEAILIDLLLRFHQDRPEQEIFSEIHNTSELEAMLLKDELDIALVEGEIRSEYLIIRQFLLDELIFVIAPHHPLQLKTAISTADLSSLPFFIREAGSGTRKLFEDVMAANGFTPHIAGIYNNAETIKQAVAAGLGATVISRRAVHNELLHGQLASFTIPGVSFNRQFSIVYHRNKYLSAGLLHLIDLCHDCKK